MGLWGRNEVRIPFKVKAKCWVCFLSGWGPARWDMGILGMCLWKEIFYPFLTSTKKPQSETRALAFAGTCSATASCVTFGK